MIALLKDKPLESTPGTKYAYSNTNYHLLAMIVEKVSGQTFADYLTAHEFRPAGMTAARLADPKTPSPPPLATGYNWNGKALTRNTLRFPQAINFGDSGLLSTVGDLAKWADALADGRLLTPTMIRQMETPGKLADGTPVSYGLGWIVSEYRGHRLIGHSGAEPGYSSSLFRFPDDHLTVILLSNAFDGTPLTDSLAAGIAARFLPAPPSEIASAVDPEPKTTALLRAVLTDLAAGKADPARFTPQMNAALTPTVIAQSNQTLSTLGTLGALTFLKREDKDGLNLYRYRAVYGKTPVLCLLALTPDGKIAGLRPQTEGTNGL